MIDVDSVLVCVFCIDVDVVIGTVAQFLVSYCSCGVVLVVFDPVLISVYCVDIDLKVDIGCIVFLYRLAEFA